MNLRGLIKKFWSHDYVSHPVRALGILVLLVIAIFLFLRIYTHHGEGRSVPYLYGLSLKDAERVLEENKLRLSVIDSVFIPQLDRGTVLEQNPSPGFRVKRFRTVFLTMNAVNPEKVIVPNTVGVSMRQAKALLESKGLVQGELIYVPDIAVNYVLDQQINGVTVQPGDTVYKGTAVDLVLGQGLSDEKTRVPNLLSFTLEDAKQKISESYLNLGAQIYDVNSVLDYEDTASAIVWKQYPEHSPDKFVQLGSSIDIWLTTDSTLLPESDTTMNLFDAYDQTIEDEADEGIDIW